MTELKPCPFCGEKPEIAWSDRYPRTGKGNRSEKPTKGWTVICKNLDCPICHADTRYFLTRKEAVAKWNSRCDKDTIRQHAKWIKHRNGVGDTEFLTCSRCGFPVEPETKLIDFLHDGRFCLNCGAIMDLKQKNLRGE